MIIDSVDSIDCLGWMSSSKLGRHSLQIVCLFCRVECQCCSFSAEHAKSRAAAVAVGAEKPRHPGRRSHSGHDRRPSPPSSPLQLSCRPTSIASLVTADPPPPTPSSAVTSSAVLAGLNIPPSSPLARQPGRAAIAGFDLICCFRPPHPTSFSTSCFLFLSPLSPDSPLFLYIYNSLRRCNLPTQHFGPRRHMHHTSSCRSRLHLAPTWNLDCNSWYTVFSRL